MGMIKILSQAFALDALSFFFGGGGGWEKRHFDRVKRTG